ncbi:MAG: hypothetical protein ACPG06_05600 [Alphaproteobacteria bacterium]
MKWGLGFLGVVTAAALAIGGCIYMTTEQASNPALKADAPVRLEGSPFSATRLGNAAIITTDLSPRLQAEAAAYGYSNINGPTLIKVPAWVKNPLGRYYLYFAHHKGRFLRLAYADSPTGPWTVHEPGVLDVSETPLLQELADPPLTKNEELEAAVRHMGVTELTVFARVGADAKAAQEQRTEKGELGRTEQSPHIASPDIYIDHANQRIVLFWHGLVEGTVQMSGVATSADGLSFETKPGFIAPPYLRYVNIRGRHIALTMPGLLYKAPDPLGPYEVRPQPLFDVTARHHAFHLVGNTLYIFFTRVGDAPERILVTAVDVSSDDWADWQPGEVFEVMRPEAVWEGADLPIEPSVRGETTRREHALRDPHVFNDDGQLYLVYAGGGEDAIGIAELTFTK